MWITQRASDNKGFTLIELLIAIIIIGLIAAGATVSLLAARRQARDTKRLSDIQQVRNALVIYSNQRATSPPVSSGPWSPVALGVSGALCLDDSDAGFRDSCGGGGALTIMQMVPGEARAGHTPYSYIKTAVGYEISFELEGKIGDLSGGNCTATVNGITCP